MKLTKAEKKKRHEIREEKRRLARKALTKEMLDIVLNPRDKRTQEDKNLRVYMAKCLLEEDPNMNPWDVFNNINIFICGIDVRSIESGKMPKN